MTFQHFVNLSFLVKTVQIQIINYIEIIHLSENQFIKCTRDVSCLFEQI